FVTAIHQAAQRRSTIPESERVPFTLYADEFQNFATDSFSTILSESRKWGLRLCLANQYLTQLPHGLQQAVLGNIGTLIVFRVGSQDAKLLAGELDIDGDCFERTLPFLYTLHQRKTLRAHADCRAFGLRQKHSPHAP